MSKSRGNVINPDDVVCKHGADVFRMYEMFIGPFDQAAAWDTKGIVGIDRFLRKVWRMVAEGEIVDEALDADARRLLHQTIKKVGDDIESLDLNTAVSQMMICATELAKLARMPREAAESFTRILAPFAPHLTEELWEIHGHSDGIARAPWPDFDPASLAVADVEIVVQVLGKPKAHIRIPADAGQEAMAALALADPEVVAALAGKPVRKVIAVPGRLVNIVV
jgi:leucyl-tRNA synthetase